MDKIKILGAGVSGLTAAITLAKAGKEVEIYEAGERPNQRFDHAVHAFRNYGFESGTVEKLSKIVKLPPLKEFYRVFKFSPSLKKCEIHSKEKPIFYSFLRGESKKSIDQVLLKQAQDLGVRIFFNKTIKKSEANIIATGAKRIDGIAYGFFFKDLNIEDAVYTFYDNRYALHGYAYILPYDKNSGDVVTTAFCCRNEFPLIKKFYFKMLKINKVISNAIDGAEKVCEVIGGGNFDVPFSANNNNQYYVGEAAGFQDGSKCFGVKFAILSGFLAAKSILENKDYNELWKEEFKRDLVYYFKRRIIYQRMENKDFEKMIKRLGEKISLEEHEEKKKEENPKILDIAYPFYLLKWKLFREI